MTEKESNPLKLPLTIWAVSQVLLLILEVIELIRK